MWPIPPQNTTIRMETWFIFRQYFLVYRPENFQTVPFQINGKGREKDISTIFILVIERERLKICLRQLLFWLYYSVIPHLLLFCVSASLFAFFHILARSLEWDRNLIGSRVIKHCRCRWAEQSWFSSPSPTACSVESCSFSLSTRASKEKRFACTRTAHLLYISDWWSEMCGVCVENAKLSPSPRVRLEAGGRGPSTVKNLPPDATIEGSLFSHYFVISQTTSAALQRLS